MGGAQIFGSLPIRFSYARVSFLTVRNFARVAKRTLSMRGFLMAAVVVVVVIALVNYFKIGGGVAMLGVPSGKVG